MNDIQILHNGEKAVLSSILLNDGEWLFKSVHLQEDGNGTVYCGRRIDVEYVSDEFFPFWKELDPDGLDEEG